MVKTLRSLIHEVIPMDLRVGLELLSRRRDISNAEKQEELFKLLREYNITDITPLGSGTNRYAFKLNGFVIKTATDNDGKIDNLKEFKMAKRLYPHVIKIYEVSQNGTLQVCEYIQPFQSYAEMIMYESKIKAILTELSEVYLIGDVGISRKNYSNWGLRVGSNEPVCLDFAYVYEVNSELFLCTHCKNNSMLMHTHDFVELYCPAPGCGHKYTFEDIRAKLGNDLHRHEIGDLTEEGYLMSESNVQVELTMERSNYLAKRKSVVEENNEIVTEEEYVDNFFIPTPDYSTKPKTKEDKTMITCNATQITKWDNNIKIVEATQIIDEPNYVDGIAFSGDVITDNESIQIDDNNPAITPIDTGTHTTDPTPPDVDNAEEAKSYVNRNLREYTSTSFDQDDISVPVEVNDVATPTETTDEVTETTADKVEPVVEEVQSVVANEPVETFEEDTSERLPHDKVSKAVSTISSKIAIWLKEIDAFEEIENDIKNGKKLIIAEKQKISEEIFNEVQNAVYHAITEFCKFEKTESTRADGSPCTKWIPTDTSSDASYFPTLKFITLLNGDYKIWKNSNTITDALVKYRAKHDKYLGFQPELINVLKIKMKHKVTRLTSTGLAILTDIIKDSWITEETIEKPVSDIPDSSASVEESEMMTENNTVNKNYDTPVEIQESKLVNENTTELSNNTEESSAEEFIAPAIAFSGDVNYDNNDESDDDSDNDYELMRIEIHHDELFDIVRINTSDAYGDINIPFYVNFDNCDANTAPNCDIDDRNGIWEFLAYLVPDMRFYTSNPDRWMDCNNDFTENTKFVILDTNDDETQYLMGVYVIGDISEFDIDGNFRNAFDEETIAKLNDLIGGDLSTMHNHLMVSTMNLDNIYTEEYINTLLENDDSDDCETSSEEDTNLVNQEMAALAALMGDDVPKSDDIEEKYESDEEHITFTPIRRNRKSEN